MALRPREFDEVVDGVDDFDLGGSVDAGVSFQPLGKSYGGVGALYDGAALRLREIDEVDGAHPCLFTVRVEYRLFATCRVRICVLSFYVATGNHNKFIDYSVSGKITLEVSQCVFAFGRLNFPQPSHQPTSR